MATNVSTKKKFVGIKPQPLEQNKDIPIGQPFDLNATNDNALPFGLVNLGNGKLQYTDPFSKRKIDAYVYELPNGKKQYYARYLQGMTPEVMTIEVDDKIVTPTNTTKEEKNKYRLPKEYLDAYMRMAQGENKDYSMNTYNPTDQWGSVGAAALKGLTEGTLKVLNKELTSAVGKKEGIKMAKDLGQAMKGDKGAFVNDNEELAGGFRIEDSDMVQARKNLWWQIEKDIYDHKISMQEGLAQLNATGAPQTVTQRILNMGTQNNTQNTASTATSK